MKKYGITLIEVIMSSVLLLLIVYAMYDIFNHGLLLWRKGSQRQENEQKSIVLSNRIFYELKMTAISSITTFTYDGSSISNKNYSDTSLLLEKDTNANNSISFRSAMSNGQIIVDDWMGKLRWQKYIIYYLKSDPKNAGKYLFCKKELNLGNRKGEIISIPLESFKADDINTFQIIDYINGTFAGATLSMEKIVARDIISTSFRWFTKRQIEFYVETGKPHTDTDSAGNSTNKLKFTIYN